tara:strand:+ start:3763 stop:4104 length:342 start_codon:yes stop_codon:yes gene_type:complete
MKIEEAIKIANILVDNFKMPYARQGMFASRVTKHEEKDILYIAAGGLGLYIDVDTLEVVGKENRSITQIDELESQGLGPRPLRPWEFLEHLKGDAHMLENFRTRDPAPEDYED